MSEPFLEVNDLKKHFPIRGGLFGRVTGQVYAVDGVSFTIARGETLALVGESGCGKSTVGKAILRLLPVTSGQVVLDGRRIDDMSAGRLRPLRRRVQVVFQDPFSSLNPRMRVRDVLAEPIVNFGLATTRAAVDECIALLMDKVRLPRDAVNRWPHEFSGGQRQRIGIARALAVDPRFIVADEPVSALDVSIQAQVLNLFADLQDRFGLTYVFIAHDLGVVRHVSDRIGVMYLGELVELGTAEDVYGTPRHPYTEALLSAVPEIDDGTGEPVTRERIVLPGDVPSPVDKPAGCAFAPRCRYATDLCSAERPRLVELAPGRSVACHHPLPLTAAATATSPEGPQ